jgi:hypothetical protein
MSVGCPSVSIAVGSRSLMVTVRVDQGRHLCIELGLDESVQPPDRGLNLYYQSRVVDRVTDAIADEGAAQPQRLGHSPDDGSD